MTKMLIPRMTTPDDHHVTLAMVKILTKKLYSGVN